MVNKYKRYLSLLCVCLVAAFSMYYHTGPAFNGVAANGAPYNSGTYCGTSCHSGGTYATVVSLQLLDASLNPVTSYTLGASYTLKITITGTGTTSSTRYGFQVSSSYADAPTYTNINGWGALPANTHNTLLSGRNYVEHGTQLSTNVINIPWTAPSTANSNNIVFYAAGNIVNNDGSTSGDFANTASLTINPPCIISITPTTLASGTTGTSYNQTLSQTGGTGAITYSISSGTLPPGVTLSSTGTLSGTPTAAGIYNFTVAATNGSSCNGTQSYTLVVNCPTITVSPATLPAATAGSSYSTSITQTGGSGTATYSVTSGSLPTGLTLSPSGTLSGTPSGGTYNFTITATDANNCSGSASYTLSPSCAAATLSPSTLSTATAGTSYSQNITQTGGTGTYTYAVTTGTLPTGMALSSAGLLSGTPTVPGTYNFTIRGTNQYSCTTNSQAYSFTVNCPTLSISPATLTAGSAGIAYGPVTLTTAGSVGSTITYSLQSGSLPTGMTLTSGGILSGTPSAGTYNFTVKAIDNLGCSTTQAYTLNVNCTTITLSPATLPATAPGGTYNQVISQSGGTGTVTYTVSSGALPPGLTISSSGLISGTATTAGTYNFSITATSSFGCNAVKNYSIDVTCPTVTVTPATLPGGTVGSAYSQSISQTGGTGSGIYTYSVSAGSLPTGLTLSSAGLLSGTLTAAGTYNFTVIASNGFGCTGSTTYTVVVTCPTITITPATIADINVGTAVNQAISQTGGTGTFTYAITAGSLPNGLTLSSSGLLSGTAVATGTYNFTVTATSNGCSNSQAYTVNVICPAITITPATLPNVPTGGSYSQTISQTGGNGTFTYAVSAGTLPPGITLASNGTLSGTSTAAGTYSFTITGTSQYGCTASQAYNNVMVTCPTISLTATLPNSTIGVTYSQNIVATGGSGTTTYAVTAGALPTGLTLTTAGLLSGTPTVNGTYNFTVTATDGFGCTGTKAYTIIVSCPTMTLSALTTPTKGTPYSQIITQTGSTGTITYAVTSGTLPTGLTLSATGVLSGTPTATGLFSFTVTATNAFSCTGSRAYTFNVVCPTITVSPTTLPGNNLGNTYSQTVTQTGGNGTVTYTVSAGALPTGLSLNASTGTITGTTSVNGTYNFTITATDAFGCTASRSYSVTVACATITVSPTTLPSVLVGNTYSQTITQTGGTNITYSISAGALPAGLNLNATTGAITGTPTVTGTFSFTVKATDGAGCFGTRSLAIVVSCPAITLSPSTLANSSPGAAYNQTITQAGGQGTITYSLLSGSLPTGLSLNTSTGAITGTPTIAGVYSFTVKATDGFGCTGIQAYAVSITCPSMSLFPASLPNADLGTAYSQTVSQTGGIGTITYSVSTGTLPTGLSLNASTGAITGTVTTNGTYNFTIMASNGLGCTVSKSYTIVVACPAITLSPTTLPGALLGSTYNQAIQQTGSSTTVTYSVSSGTLPAGLSLNPATGAITGTVTANGSYTFTISATNTAGCSGTQSYTVDIACPVMSISPTTLPNLSLNAPFSQSVTQTGATGTITYTVTAGVLPPGLTLDAVTGLLSGAPNTSGSFTFTITAANSVGCSVSQSYTMIVNCPIISISPDILPDVQAGGSYVQSLVAAGGAGNYNYDILAGTLPPSMSLASVGTIFGFGVTAGTYSFSVKVTDDQGCVGYKAYSITVTCPLLTILPEVLPGGNVGSQYVQLLTEDGTATGSFVYTVASGSLPPGLILEPSGEITGTPLVSGTYTFSLTVTDDYQCTGTQPFTMVIQPRVSVQNVKANGGEITVMLLPNTITQETTARIQSGSSYKADVEVTDITGKTMLHDNVSVQAGENNIKYDFSSLKAGVYLFHITGSQPIKFVKL